MSTTEPEPAEPAEPAEIDTSGMGPDDDTEDADSEGGDDG